MNVLMLLQRKALVDLRTFTVVLYSDHSVHGIEASSHEEDEDEADVCLAIEEVVKILIISTQMGVISFVTGCNGNPITIPPTWIIMVQRLGSRRK